MTGLLKSLATVHGPVRQQALPLLRCVGRYWRLLGADAGAVRAAHVSTECTLDMLGDLARYGLVLPLAEVQTGALLWWPEQAAPDGELQVPAAVGDRDLVLSGSLSRIQWTVASPATDRWRYGVSATARWMAASARLPVIHHELLSVAACIDTLPLGDVCLTLGRLDPAVFAWPWRRSSWEAIERRALLLRERRRLALGLAVQHDATELDELIRRHFVLPMARQLLDAVNPHAQRRLHVLTPDQLTCVDSSAQVIDLPVGRYLSDDPLSENLYLLGGRRIHATTALARQLRCTGRSLVALAHRTQMAALAQQAGAPTESPIEWGAAMLAALQLDYLQTHRTVP